MYGTVLGVKVKLKQFQQMFDREVDYLGDEITDALTEASLYADQLLIKRYDLTVIKADVPALVNEFAVVKACSMLIPQLSLTDASLPIEAIETFTNRAKMIANIFLDGDVLDNSSVVIDYTLISEVFTLNVVEEE